MNKKNHVLTSRQSDLSNTEIFIEYSKAHSKTKINQ